MFHLNWKVKAHLASNVFKNAYTSAYTASQQAQFPVISNVVYATSYAINTTRQLLKSLKPKNPFGGA